MTNQNWTFKNTNKPDENLFGLTSNETLVISGDSHRTIQYYGENTTPIYSLFYFFLNIPALNI